MHSYPECIYIISSLWDFANTIFAAEAQIVETKEVPPALRGGGAGAEEGHGSEKPVAKNPLPYGAEKCYTISKWNGSGKN